MLNYGANSNEIKKRILFQLISHEFGHVLNLRHNFYGSFDARHWPSGKNVLKSSSVMDYINQKDEAIAPLKALYGPYDEAALVYAYSGGKKDLSKERKTHYLFCTDHHEPLNFLCNSFDQGQTPSQVMMSLIENYEESYLVRNLRADRAYWNTSAYPIDMLITMLNIKQALMMWKTAFNQNDILNLLDQSAKSYTSSDRQSISIQVQEDIKQAIKLGFAFYHSVLQLSKTEDEDDENNRHWRPYTSNESGTVKRIGTFWDKFFALDFLMGDDNIVYNPNYPLDYASYLTSFNSIRIL